MTIRTVVIGAPRAGKTTYAIARGVRERVHVYHTDDLIGTLSWSDLSDHVATEWFAEPGPWIIEGVAAVRALRKWLAANPDGAPCDEVVVLEQPYIELTGRQAGMAKACATIWAEIEPEMRARRVNVPEWSNRSLSWAKA